LSHLGASHRRWKMQINIWEIIYLNCGERYELMMIDDSSYTHPHELLIYVLNDNR